MPDKYQRKPKLWCGCISMPGEVRTDLLSCVSLEWGTKPRQVRWWFKLLLRYDITTSWGNETLRPVVLFWQLSHISYNGIISKLFVSQHLRDANFKFLGDFFMILFSNYDWHKLTTKESGKCYCENCGTYLEIITPGKHILLIWMRTFILYVLCTNNSGM